MLVAGDLNDHPRGGSLAALLARTDLVDAMSLKYYRGAYQRGTAKEKIDYLLLSPALRRKVEHVDVFRKGFYSPSKWESFENITREHTVTSSLAGGTKTEHGRRVAGGREGRDR